VAADRAGTLHFAWVASGNGINELHYQRRRAGSPPAPRDTVLDTSGSLLQGPSIACDDSGGVHLVFENWSAQSPTPDYRLWSPSHGWDYGATSLSKDEAPGVFPVALPFGLGDVTTLYLREDPSGLQLVQRLRQLGVPATASVPLAASPAAGGLAIAPNPVRAGARIGLSANAGGDRRFEIFDLAGRRIAEVPASTSGARLIAEVGSGVTSRWPGGVYFARVAGRAETRRFVVLR